MKYKYNNESNEKSIKSVTKSSVFKTPSNISNGAFYKNGSRLSAF